MANDEEHEMDYIEIVAETDKAILLMVETDWEEWIPKSQIIDMDRDQNTVVLPQWLAEAKGFS